MAAKPISQREARRLRKELADLRERDKVRQNRYRSDYPGGFHIANYDLDNHVLGRIESSEWLGAHLVAKRCNSTLRIYMVPKS